MKTYTFYHYETGCKLPVAASSLVEAEHQAGLGYRLFMISK